MKANLNLIGLFPVALGLDETQSVIQYAAADCVVQLKWLEPTFRQLEPNSELTQTQSAGYELTIIDTGFEHEDRRPMEETAQQTFVGDVSIEVAAALMFLVTAADELNLAGCSDDKIAPEKKAWNAITERCYDVVEAWITLTGLPYNLRPIP